MQLSINWLTSNSIDLSHDYLYDQRTLSRVYLKIPRNEISKMKEEKENGKQKRFRLEL